MIFINYRKSDTQWAADRLADRLKQVFRSEDVFKDDHDIKIGEHWPERLRDELSKSLIVLTLIGNDWLNAKNIDGTRRIDDQEDWVRNEIVTALDNKKIVLPVTIDGSPMPASEDLPEPPLTSLTFLQSTNLRGGKLFDADAESLVKRIKELIEIEDRSKIGRSNFSLEPHVNEVLRWPQTKSYIEWYRQNRSKVMTFGTGVEMIDIDKMYVPTQLYRWHHDRAPSKQPVGTVLEVAGESQALVVVGEPGQGKTCALMRLGWEASKLGESSDFTRKQIPIFVQLKEFPDISGKPELEIVIDREISKCGITLEKAKELRKVALSESKLLVILDGLDELGIEQRRGIVEGINAFGIRWCEKSRSNGPEDKRLNRVVLTCRSSFFDGVHWSLDNNVFKFYSVKEWEEKAVNDYVSAFADASTIFNPSENSIVRLQSLLTGSQFFRDFGSLQEMARRPFLLMLVCIIFFDRASRIENTDENWLPVSRAMLYRRAFEWMQKEWDEARAVPIRVPLKSEIDRIVQRDVLATVAKEHFESEDCDNRFIFPSHDYLGRLIKAALGPFGMHYEMVLKRFEVDYGLFVADERLSYRFSHQSFHEFFVAEWYVTQDDGFCNLAKRVWEENFRDILLIACETEGVGHRIVHRVGLDLEELWTREPSLCLLCDLLRTLPFSGNPNSLVRLLSLLGATCVMVIYARDLAFKSILGLGDNRMHVKTSKLEQVLLELLNRCLSRKIDASIFDIERCIGLIRIVVKDFDFDYAKGLNVEDEVRMVLEGFGPLSSTEMDDTRMPVSLVEIGLNEGVVQRLKSDSDKLARYFDSMKGFLECWKAVGKVMGHRPKESDWIKELDVICSL